MAARKFLIPDSAAAALLTASVYDGPRVTLTRQLTADEWRGVKSILEKLGAEYVPGASAFEFEPDQDARTLVMAALDAGHVMAPSGLHGFVATPGAVAVDLVDQYGEMRPVRGRKLHVLEPSAGKGPWVCAALGDVDPALLVGADPGWLHVTAVEMDARRARYIPTGPAVTVHVDTFEAFHGREQTRAITYDRIIMNPPFSTPGRPMLWADHVLLAWELLAPGGRLVAIVPAAVLDVRVDKRHRAVRELIEHHGGAEELDRATFAESGFMVRTAVVWLDRPTVESFDHDRERVMSGASPYELRPSTDTLPGLEVERLIFTPAAAKYTPVQSWYDSWRGTTRTVRYLADCVTCDRPTWGFDDGENDPRGVLGEASAYTLRAEEYDRAGPSVGLCFSCANTDAETYNRAVTLAMARWREIAPVPAPAGAFVSPWSLVDAA